MDVFGDAFDSVVMFVGCVLIVIGLVLFIIGKRESANSNHVEGFGIKLNVSNPSIILIVLGVVLLLVPRLLPNPDPRAGEQKTTQQPAKKHGPLNNTEPAKQIKAAQEQVNPVEVVTPTAYFPSGVWQLTGYQENGVNNSANVSASAVFTKQSSLTYGWRTEFSFVDNWGNLARYQYQGTTVFNNGGYYISFLSSNAPDFVRQTNVPLELKLDNDGQLHMRYFFNNSEVLLHWQKS
ncbi:MAG: hypothetical protein ACPG52_07810 [Cognaticolwellia sp.]